MNLVLFEPAEVAAPLSRRDPRALHVIEILRRRPGDTFDAGVIDGPRGKATVTALDAESITLAFTPTTAVPPADPITLLVGLPRPQTARDILRDASTLGVGALHFVTTEKGDPNYASSSLWTRGEWRRHLIAGAAQAFTTRIPAVTYGRPLAELLAELPSDGMRLALDNYESSAALAGIERPPAALAAVLAIGAERGWSAAERDQLRGAGFQLVHLGPRVLRTETACIAALTLLRAKLGL